MATIKHNLNNIVIDRVLRGVFSDKEDNIIFSLNQVQNLSLNSTSESQEVVDALGVSIMELMRSKAIEASAENAIYDFGLLAAQYGTKKVEGVAMTVPASIKVNKYIFLVSPSLNMMSIIHIRATNAIIEIITTLLQRECLSISSSFFIFGKSIVVKKEDRHQEANHQCHLMMAFLAC